MPGDLFLATGVRGPGIQVALASRGTFADTPLSDADREGLRDRPAAARQDYREGRGLLRWSLNRVFGPRYATAPVIPDCRGKPVLLTDVRIGISVSHSGNAVAVAMAAGRDVGVDVQTPALPSPGLIARCCRPQDREWMASLPEGLRSRAFTALWTVQESCLKACGEGVAFRPGRVPVVPFQLAGRWRGHAWRVLPPFAGDLVAVAVSGPPGSPGAVHVLTAGTTSSAPPPTVPEIPEFPAERTP
ncbi:4'-phosphopantetheinyl transferase family protein [Streptomyces sp. NPDC060198]|uniref:4'-phosphopantetheinyl transferase family protein n=1 Tax=Streptomyces sp. NPDC060198 TaxID=3347070 RepID=UPI00365CE915